MNEWVVDRRKGGNNNLRTVAIGTSEKQGRRYVGGHLTRMCWHTCTRTVFGQPEQRMEPIDEDNLQHEVQETDILDVTLLEQTWQANTW